MAAYGYVVSPLLFHGRGGKLVKEVFDYENKLSSEMFDNEFNNASCGTVDVVETLYFSWRKQCNIS